MIITIRNPHLQDIEIDVDMQELGHEICMGIRHGLSGKDAPDDSMITDGLYAIADVLRELGEKK